MAPTAGWATVVGVVGARGGVGASTVAAALALRVHRHGWHAERRRPRRRGTGRAGATADVPRVVLVDLDPAGGGLDVHLGIEDVPGVRWPDLAGARGDVSGPELTDLLPDWAGVTVLSGDRWRPGPAPRARASSAS